MAAGEVLLNGAQLGNQGSVGFLLSTLIDASIVTAWSTFPAGPSQPWAGQDAGAPCMLTRVVLTATGGGEDYPIGAQIQASLVSTFAGPQGAISTHTSGATTSLVAPFINSNSSGSAIIVGVVFLNSASVSTVTDTNLNSYTQIITQNNTGNSLKQSLYVATNVASGPNTVTVTFTSSVTYIAITIWEQPGIVSASAADGTNAAFNSTGSTTQSTGNFTTTQSGDMIVAMCHAGVASAITPGAGYTTQVSGPSGSNFVILETQVSGAAGTYSATSTTSPASDWVIAAVALKASGSGFGSPNVTLATISSRALNGILNNQYSVSQSTPYQYYRYLSSPGSFGSIADLDFYATYTAGMTAAAVTPKMSLWGGNFDQPVVVRLSCTTTDAAIYYTLDGTTPTTSSTLYSSPFVVGTTSTLNAIAVSAGVSNSRVASAIFYISPNSIVSTNLMPLDDRGQRMWAVDYWVFQDPISGYWYMYGFNCNQIGVVTSGTIGINIYRSADLRNWTYVSITNTPPAGQAKGFNGNTARPVVLYNALNNNYVFWTHKTNALQNYTSTNPGGPFTLISSYSTLLGSSGVNSDNFAFLDADGVTAYICFGDNGLNNFYFAQLTPDYLNVVGTGGTWTSYPQVATFGQHLDGVKMVYRGGTYFLQSSQSTQWAPSINKYWTASSPMGPWTAKGNPDLPVPGGVAGTYTDNTIGFNSQLSQFLYLPGRNAYIYVGDAYNTGLNGSTGSSTTANFQAYTNVLLPIAFPTPTTMTISWNNSWSYDGFFPTVSGGPLPASGLSVIGRVSTWTNNEPKPANIYIDNSNNYFFTSGVVSEVLPSGATSFTPISVQSGLYWRIRTVNANGTGVSLTFPAPNQLPPVIAPSTGLYVVLTIESSYIVEFLTAGVDYSQSIETIKSGPYQDSGVAFQALWTLLNPVLLPNPLPIPSPGPWTTT